ncbi:AlbA family DNA-binding domain-containing protein [Thiocapsa rosea]|uniref:Putative DNA-binding protein n=1 Tax=Thiocapsa rosea TaxID=69360 RepID=A0A495V6I0_9GAMM|nr:ATP-binding protein [Thiocapsa rosea]RKT44991.1 putative DNA-binding protein [Thiocapsa rosea]
MAEIEKILSESRFNDLLGIAESHRLEFKSQPYDLQQTKQQHELAKDVSALANSDGGCIVVGIKTKKDLNQKLDIVDKVRPFARSFFDRDKLFETIEKWVFPHIQNVRIDWHDALQDVGKGLFSIAVPVQEQASKPYLVIRNIDDEDNVYGNVVGIFERRRDAVSHRTPQGIHSLLSFAENTIELSNRLSSIESLLMERNIKDRKQGEEDYARTIDGVVEERIRECAEAADLKGRAYLSIACFPSQRVDIPTLFRGQNDAVVKLIDQPPRYRDSGWDLRTSRLSKPIRGLLRRAVEPGALSLDVWRDGVIIAVVSADKDYLSWGRYSSNDDIPNINPIALIEVISLFSRLSKYILRLAEPPPENAGFRLSFSNITQNGKAYRLRSLNYIGMSKEAPSSDMVINVPRQDLEAQDDELAFNVFCSVFEWFGIDHDKIPVAKIREDGVYVLDIESIVNLRG